MTTLEKDPEDGHPSDVPRPDADGSATQASSQAFRACWHRLPRAFGVAVIARLRLNGFGVRDRMRARYREQTVDTGPWSWPNLLAIALFWGFVSILFLDPHVRVFTSQAPRDVWWIFHWVTRLGKSDWILIPTGVLILIGLLVDWTSVPRRARRALARVMSDAGLVFASVAVAGILVLALKALLGRARPGHMEELGAFDFTFLTFQAGYPSFPSGHSCTAAALAITLACLLPRWRWVFVVLGFWLGASRVVVGAHYPSDVIGGLLLGGAVAWMVCKLFAKCRCSLTVAPDGRLRPCPWRGAYRDAFKASVNFLVRTLRRS